MARLALAFDILARDKASGTLKNIGINLGNVTKSINVVKGGIAGVAAGFVGGRVIGSIKKMANEASGLNETISKSRNIFGGSSGAIEKWAKGAARNLGMSRQQALDGASAFGNLFDQLGFGAGQAAKMSTGFAQMAADAASFNNADPSEVMDAFLSATRGEYDALQKFIPTASAATIEAEALRMTHKKSASDLTAADKAAALYSVSTRDLGKAHGDFARTAGGFANQQRIMAANWADLRVKIGQYFLPMFTKAAQYMNREGFNALTRIVGVLGNVGESAGRMARAVTRSLGGAFGDAVDGATLNLTELADWFETHQAGIIRFFVGIGDAAFGLGRGLARFVSGAIRGFGMFTGGLADMIDKIAPFATTVLDTIISIENALGHDTKALRDARDNMGPMLADTSRGLRDARTKANEAADAFDKKVFPALDRAQGAMHKVAEQEIWKAKQADAAARARHAIRDIGTAADGSQIKLKHWNDRTKLGADAQYGLMRRIRDARARMLEQREAGIKAGDSQAELTKRWNKGREALYREFRQMGLSKEEARKLAIQYGKVPKKQETKVTQPGMQAAKSDAKRLGSLIREIPATKKVTITFSAKSFVGADGIRYRVNTSAPSSVGRSGPAIQFGGKPLTLDEHGVPQTVGSGPGPNQGGPDPKRSKIIVNTARLPRNARNQPGEIRDMITGYEQGIGNALGKAVAANVGVGDSGAPGGRVGIVPGGLAAAMAAMRRRGARSFTTYPGHHPSMARARDVTPHSWAIANAARAIKGIWYVIYRMKIASKNHGNTWRDYHPTNFRGDWRHVRHVHIASYDQGGKLPRGLSLAVNNTGRSEVVRPGGGSDRPVNIYIDLGDGVTQRVQGVIDENGEYQAGLSRAGWR